MAPDVTITLSFDQGTAAATTQTAAAGELPTPISLEQLQGASSTGAPVPLSPAALSSTVTAAGTNALPQPLSMEQLQATSVAATPSPQPIEALLGGGGPPEPRPLEDLGVGGATELPTPMSLEALEQATTRTRAAGTKR